LGIINSRDLQNKIIVFSPPVFAFLIRKAKGGVGKLVREELAIPEGWEGPLFIQ